MQLTGNQPGSQGRDVRRGRISNNDFEAVGRTFIGTIAEGLIFNGLGGRDVLNAVANINSLSFPNNVRSAFLTGIRNSSIDLGRGRDNVRVNAQVSTRDQGGVIASSIGLSSTGLSTGADNDRINISTATRVSGDGSDASARGLVGSQISGGNGTDRIQISALASKADDSLGSAFNGRTIGTTVSAEGLIGGSTISGGSGNDTITVAARTVVNSDVSDSDSFTFGSTSFLASFPNTIDGGQGNDTIRINVSAVNRSDGALEAVGVDLNTLIAGGEGNDRIFVDVRGSASTLNSTVRFVGVEGSSAILNGGSGNDNIRVNVTGRSRNGTSVGVADGGQLLGGQGNDRFFVRGVNLDLDDALINGGSGNDVFNTGIGSATINGDVGNDRILLNFFDASTMSIELLGANSIRITGTQDKLGNSDPWTQTITNVERYQIGGNIFNAAQVVDRLA